MSLRGWKSAPGLRIWGMDASHAFSGLGGIRPPAVLFEIDAKCMTEPLNAYRY